MNVASIYITPEHELLREQIARFIAREVEPFALAWEEAGCTPREVLRKMGDAGLFGLMARQGLIGISVWCHGNPMSVVRPT